MSGLHYGGYVAKFSGMGELFVGKASILSEHVWARKKEMGSGVTCG